MSWSSSRSRRSFPDVAPCFVGEGAGPDERGSVTAETALVLPLLVVVLAGLLSVLAAAAGSLAAQEAARAGARDLARGADAATVRRELLQRWPDAGWTVSRSGDEVTVTVRRPVHLVRPLTGVLGRADVSGSATVTVEPADPP